MYLFLCSFHCWWHTELPRNIYWKENKQWNKKFSETFMFNCCIKALVNYAYFMNFGQILWPTLMLILSQKNCTQYISCPICVHHAFHCVAACHFRIFLVTSYFILNVYQLGWRSSPATSHCYLSNCWKIWVCENVPLWDYVLNCLQVFIVVISTFNCCYRYGTSLFKRFQKAGYPVQMLKTQYRMHPEVFTSLTLNLLLALFA